MNETNPEQSSYKYPRPKRKTPTPLLLKVARISAEKTDLKIKNEELKIKEQQARRKTDKLENDLKETKSNLEIARLDDLTELLNRGAFFAKLENVRRKGIAGTLLMLDLNKFKEINDTLGHFVGDQALQEVAKYLKQNSREGDLICRLGGDEFLIFYPNSTPEEIENKFKGSIEINFSPDPSNPSTQIPLTLSGGIVKLGPQDDLHLSLTEVDASMYEGKQGGKSRLIIAKQH